MKSPTRRPSTKAAPVLKVLERWQKATPEPRCELYYTTPYQLLVSVMLSAQATDKQVNKVMQPLYDRGLDLPQVLAGGEAHFLSQIRSIGLAPTKAKNVLRMSALLREQFSDEVPRTRAALESLPGVGRKTSNVILGELFQEPTLAVDTHVFRVSRRLGWQNEKTPEKAELKLLQLIATKYLPKAHHWLILHGRYVCKASTPDCEHCLLADLCPKIGI